MILPLICLIVAVVLLDGAISFYKCKSKIDICFGLYFLAAGVYGFYQAFGGSS